MNDYLRREHEACARCNQYLTDNIADYNSGAKKVKRLAFADAVNNTEAKDALYTGGFGEASMEFEQKETSRSILRSGVAAIADMAEGMEPDFDGISDLFRFRRGLPDAGLLALARAFYTASADYEADFISYGLPATFRDDLNNAADAFEAATNAASAAKGDRVGAGAELAASVKLEVQLKRTMDPIVRSTYAGNVAKLAAWASAYHVEKAPTKKDPPAPPTP